LNLLRFHSWCPPEAAFVAADELGMYFHIECSSWANSTNSLVVFSPSMCWNARAVPAQCGLSAIHPPEATREILDCLGLPSRAPLIARAVPEDADEPE
jgi:hypothetical protein